MRRLLTLAVLVLAVGGAPAYALAASQPVAAQTLRTASSQQQLPPPTVAEVSSPAGTHPGALLVVAGLFLAAALLPTRRLADRFPPAATVAQLRFMVAVASFGIVIGVAAAKFPG